MDDLALDLELSGASAAEIASLAQRAEAAGFSRLWAPELYRSSTIPLAVAGGATRTIEVATGIALAFTRSPFVLALEALDLDDLTGGRTVIGLGAGVRRLNQDWHAVPSYDPPVARMRETIASVRELVAALAEGRDARSPGDHVSVRVTGYRRPMRAVRARIPVWLAAVLPRMARLAGEVSDGFIDHPVTSLEWMDAELRPAIVRGAREAGRETPPICGALIVACDDGDPDAARRAAALSVGFYATVRTYERMFADHGFGDRLGAIRRAFLAHRPDELADAVGPDMVAAFAAAGSAADVRAAVSRYDGRVERMWLVPPHHDQDLDDTRRWQEGILAAFGRT